MCITDKMIGKKEVFKVPSMDLEFIWNGRKSEIRPIKVPKHFKMDKEVGI